MTGPGLKICGSRSQRLCDRDHSEPAEPLRSHQSRQSRRRRDIAQRLEVRREEHAIDLLSQAGHDVTKYTIACCNDTCLNRATVYDVQHMCGHGKVILDAESVTLDELLTIAHDIAAETAFIAHAEEQLA